MQHLADPELKLNKVLNDDSYYHQLFSKVNYYSPQIYQIFNIARNLMSENSEFSAELKALLKPDFDTKNVIKEAEEEVQSSKSTSGNEDFFIDNMRSITEIPFLLKKQFLLPDIIFDQKLMHKELLIKKQHVYEKRLSFTDFIEDQNSLSREKFLRRQRTYVLMDVSGSTEKYDRILLEKAIVLGFLENNQKEFGEVYFRSFNQHVSKLYRTMGQNDYKAIVNKAILPVLPEGQTNTQKALEVALDDLNHYGIDHKAEVLLVTDGLSSLDAAKIFEKADEVKINIVMIGKDPIYFSEKELHEHFNSQHQREISKIDQQHFSDAAKEKKKELEKFQKFDKKKVQRDIENSYKKSMRELAEKSGGKFIEIGDLDQSFFSSTALIEQVKKELAFLQERLQKINLSPIERDQLLEEYLSLKNYLNYLLSVHKSDKNLQKELDQVSDEMLAFLDENDQLLEAIEESALRVEMSFSDLNQLKSVSMFQLFKLLFKRMRYLVFKSATH